jgi:phosphoglycolate phosphatase-like HAD superfamily hydrolase
MFIFDLDHTVIDSSHRQSTLPCGSLDLAHWIENNTPEKIAKDTLLPLADIWKNAKKSGETIGVCTARVLQDADYEFLADNGLEFDFILSRPMGDNTGDAELKKRLLTEYAQYEKQSLPQFVRGIQAFFDDNKSVLKMLKSIGVKTYDALEINGNA